MRKAIRIESKDFSDLLNILFKGDNTNNMRKKTKGRSKSLPYRATVYPQIKGGY